MMRRAFILPAAVLLVLGLAAVGVSKLVATQTDRPDCPGKIVCPQTGELICRDKCPTVDPNRPDCPGRIICPLTGELVCKDRCPLNDAPEDVSETEAAPSCCQGGK